MTSDMYAQYRPTVRLVLQDQEKSFSDYYDFGIGKFASPLVPSIFVQRTEQEVTPLQKVKIDKELNLSYSLKKFNFGVNGSVSLVIVGVYDRLYKAVRFERTGQLTTLYTETGVFYKAKEFGIELSRDQQDHIMKHFVESVVYDLKKVFNIADSPIVLLVPGDTEYRSHRIFRDAKLDGYDFYKVVTVYDMIESFYKFHESRSKTTNPF